MTLKKNKKITIIGSGSMATAIGKVLHDSGNDNIIIYGIDNDELSDLKKGQNIKYFPKKTNIPIFKTTNNLKEAIDNASYIILAVPSKFMDAVIKEILTKLNSNIVFINVSKGFYPNSNMSLHKGIKNESLNNDFFRGVVSLIGPSHAEDIVKESLTIIAAVDNEYELIKEVQPLFKTPYFKTYSQTDVIGSEVGASYKNVIAIASGLASGLGNGVNTTAALITRGISEILRYNKFMGGNNDTIMGLTGIGDLIVTATSELSRNYTFGKEFAKNKGVVSTSNNTVEGLISLKYIYNIGQKSNIYLPIVESLYKIIFNKGDIKKIIKKYWDEEFKDE